MNKDLINEQILKKMPSIDVSFLETLKEEYQRFPVFVETGTYEGETIFAMEPLFEELFTIECSPKYFESTRSKYKSNKISFLFGDSSIVLKDLLPQIHKNCIFFLDGHWSSGDTGKGEKDCPLLEEIHCINTLYHHRAIIIIDDYRLFGTHYSEDWSDISKTKILSIFDSRVEMVYHLRSIHAEDDRLVIHINSYQQL